MRPSSLTKAEILIVGGGHAGLSLAAVLGAAGLSVICLERGPNKPRGDDGRTLALSFRSMCVLDKAGVTDFIRKHACPILDIRVADQTSPLFLDFDHREVGDEPFGWIIENHLFEQALRQRIRRMKNVRMVFDAVIDSIERDLHAAHITLEDGRAFEGALIAGADGRKSQCRAMAGIETYGWSYKQTAVVCLIKHSLPHNNVAVEHFQPGGPFATLPMTKQRSSIVWTEKTGAAKALMDMDEASFTAVLQEKAGDYLGDIKLLGKRFAFPLVLQHAQHYTAERLVLVGDAAHGIHPIAGQGFNLGMGDIEALAEELLKALHLGLDLGSAELLRNYEKRRKFDNGNMVLMTDVLDRLFSNSVPPVQVLRQIGLGAVQRIPPLKRFFMRTAMGRMAG